jgi:hypothetical protein
MLEGRMMGDHLGRLGVEREEIEGNLVVYPIYQSLFLSTCTCSLL